MLCSRECCAEQTLIIAVSCAAAWPYYASLVRAAEARLDAAGIRSRGCADGDLALGTYTSLRNEAFIPRKVAHGRYVSIPESDVAAPGQGAGAVEAGRAGGGGPDAEQVELVYPPNDDGWNAAGHCCPLPIFQMRCAASGLGVQEPSAREAEPQWLE